jgi:hypothetical protein
VILCHLKPQRDLLVMAQRAGGEVEPTMKQRNEERPTDWIPGR